MLAEVRGSGVGLGYRAPGTGFRCKLSSGSDLSSGLSLDTMPILPLQREHVDKRLGSQSDGLGGEERTEHLLRFCGGSSGGR